MSPQLPPGPTKPRATIRDVAILAGVGIKTVSRVINDEANVSPQMRQRVQRAVLALNFKPNPGAGALRRGDTKTMTLGLLCDAVDNPFFAAVNRAVERVATLRGTAVFAASSGEDSQHERALVEAFSRRRVDGLIIATVDHEHTYLQPERDLGLPVVFIDRPPAGLIADAVLSDNYESAVAATRHLITIGHRRIAYLGDDHTITTARDRHRGYTHAMTAAGLDPRHVDNLRSSAEATGAARDLLTSSDPPTALFTAQNLVTIGALHALHQLDRQDQIAQVGFDDFLLADLIRPGVTVVAQDPARVGTLAAERIFARIDGDTGSARTIVVPATLIPRGSGEIPPPVDA